MPGQVNFNLDAVDDPVLPDGIPSFEGGQFSNVRGNLLQANQSKVLGNCDIDKLGKLRTRRGTMQVGTTTPANVAGKPVQGLTSYQTATQNYIVAAHNAKLWAFDGTNWVQIGLGGTADGEDIVIARIGAINNPAVIGPPAIPAGYPIGTTDIVVDGLPAVAAPLLAAGEKLYFTSNLRTDYFEYTIKAWNAGTNTITLEDPGLVFPVKDNWAFTVLRPAKVANPTPGNRYGTGSTVIGISGYNGEVFNTEKFVIKSENITHTVSAHVGTTTQLTFSPALQADWPGAGGVNAPVMFAQGNDSLFFTDGTGPIYAWTGGIPSSSTVGPGTLMKIGSHSLLDDFNGSFHSAQTTPPQNVKVIIWFQNRLIASGIASEPDAIYFSDFFDGTSWDAFYQKVRIGGGESDPITGLLAWTDINMLVYKKNSCYIINLDPAQNPDPTDPTLLVASFAVKQLHKLIGCPAPLSAIQVGGGSTTPGSDVFFVDGDKKVHSIRRVMAAETQQEVGQAMSLPIQDVLDNINVAEIDQCTAMYHNEHYILSFPSTQGLDGGLTPSGAVSYNLLTQSWCGVWGWRATCFSRRTDLGSYSRLILGDVNGYVRQWLDDQSLDEETSASYVDTYGGVEHPFITSIWTRAITFGDYYNFKTGLSVEFEFDESNAEQVTVYVVLDGVVQNFPPLRGLLAPPFSTLTETRLRLPFTLPVVLPNSPGLKRLAFDLQRYGTWRELQFRITSPAGKLAIRSIRVCGFMDTLRLQTIPEGGLRSSGGDVVFPGVPGP